MTLPFYGNETKFSNLNLEFKRSLTGQISLGETQVRGLLNKPSGAIKLGQDGSLKSASGSILFTTTGTQSWTVPAWVYSVNIACVGAGGLGWCGAPPGLNISGFWSDGGGGGALSYSNNVSVYPGQTLDIRVGSGTSTEYDYSLSRTSEVSKTNLDMIEILVSAQGGSVISGGLASNGIGNVKYSGGNGGSTRYVNYPAGNSPIGGGGGGSAGWAGNGGNGGSRDSVDGTSGTGDGSSGGGTGWIVLDGGQAGGGGGGGVSTIYENTTRTAGIGGLPGFNTPSLRAGRLGGGYGASGGVGGGYGGGGGGPTSGGTTPGGNGFVYILWFSDPLPIEQINIAHDPFGPL